MCVNIVPPTDLSPPFCCTYEQMGGLITAFKDTLIDYNETLKWSTIKCVFKTLATRQQYICTVLYSYIYFSISSFKIVAFFSIRKIETRKIKSFKGLRPDLNPGCHRSGSCFVRILDLRSDYMTFMSFQI